MSACKIAKNTVNALHLVQMKLIPYRSIFEWGNFEDCYLFFVSQMAVSNKGFLPKGEKFEQINCLLSKNESKLLKDLKKLNDKKLLERS